MSRISLSKSCVSCAAALLLGAAVSGMASPSAGENPTPKPVPLSFDFEAGLDGWTAGADGSEAVLRPGEEFHRRGHVVELKADGAVSATLRLSRQVDLSAFKSLRFDVVMPRTLAHTHLVVCFVDSDDFWYQTWRPIIPRAGGWETVEVDLRGEAAQLEPLGHARPWGPYVARGVKEIGIRMFADRKVRASVYLDNITLTPLPDEDPPQVIYDFETSGDEVGRFNRFELTFELKRTYENPYDPAQVEVLGEFVSPSGKVAVVPGFFYQNFERRLGQKVESLIPVGPPKWKVRFAPREIGSYSYRLSVSDLHGVLRIPPQRFTCVPSDNPGFVRVCADDARYFEHEDGSFFYPIGHNIPATFNEKAAEQLGLTVEKREGTAAYDRFLDGMARGKENFARIWLGAWSFGLEWTKRYDRAYAGLGRYNQENAWRLDYVLERAEELGIYVQLAMTTFAHFRAETFEGGWDYSPYNVRNGGPISLPQQFWSHADSQDMYQRMVRYVTARWGYSSHIAAWEICNEINLVTAYDRHKHEIMAWHRRCVETIRKYDPNQHLITTNFSAYTLGGDILRMPEISYSSTNNYCVQMVDMMRKTIFPMKAAFNKPALMTECGYDYQGASPETTERYLHIGLWSSYMIPFAGAGMSWWWDFLDDRNLYGMFRPLAEFARGEERRKRGLEMADGILLDANAGAAPDLAAISLQNADAGYFWIYERRLLRAEGDLDFDPEPRQGVTLELTRLSDGTYHVEFWDTWRGGRVRELTAEAKNGALRCPIPEFTGDIAGKLRRVAG